MAQPVEGRTCWNEVGVQGNATCSELQKFFHCRACPVYSRMAVQLLDRPLPSDYRREWTDRFMQPRLLAAAPRASAVLFRIYAEWLALPTQAFQEVAEHRLIHSLPHRQQGVVLGLVNVRGELLICVSLGHLLGLDQDPAGHAPCRTYNRVLVTNWDGQRLVIPTHEIGCIHRFQMSEIKEPPATLARSNPTYIQGLLSWRGRTVGFLDAERLFAALNRSLT